MALTLTQDDLNAIVAQFNTDKPFVTLADGVAHGGTPGSSTATLALTKLHITNAAASAVVISSAHNPTFSIENTAGGTALDIEASGGGGGGIGIYVYGDNAGVEFDGDVGLYLYGNAGAETHTGTLNAFLIENASGGTEPAFRVAAPDGHGIQVSAAGIGKHDINLAGDGLIAGDFAAFTETYAADGATVKLSQALYEILSFLEERSISGTTMTCKKRDGSTTALQITMNSETTPTSVTRSS